MHDAGGDRDQVESACDPQQETAGEMALQFYPADAPGLGVEQVVDVKRGIGIVHGVVLHASGVMASGAGAKGLSRLSILSIWILPGYEKPSYAATWRALR